MNIILSPTDLIAIYGAVVATLVAYHQLRDSHPRVRVEVQRLYLVGFYGPRTEMIQVRAVNVGSRTVTFESLPSLNDFVVPVPNLPSDSFPRDVVPGSSCKIFFDPSILADVLRKNGAHERVNLVGKYTDATGRVFRSKPFAFDLESPQGNESSDSGTHPEPTPR